MSFACAKSFKSQVQGQVCYNLLILYNTHNKNNNKRNNKTKQQRTDSALTIALYPTLSHSTILLTRFGGRSFNCQKFRKNQKQQQQQTEKHEAIIE